MRSPLSQVAKSIAATVVVAIGVTAGSLTSATAQAHTAMAASIAPNPQFKTTAACGTSGVSDTAVCNTAIIAALNNARKILKMASLPSNFSLTAFDKLNNDEQIFTIANIERTARGLAPIAGITVQLNNLALTAANAQKDPSTHLPLSLTGGGSAYDYGSNLAEGTANGMGANYYWMYDDGLNSPNTECTTKNESSCWGHEDNILFRYNAVPGCSKGPVSIVMGAAEVTTGGTWPPVITEIFMSDCGAVPTLYFNWTTAKALVFPA